MRMLNAPNPTDSVFAALKDAVHTPELVIAPKEFPK